MKTDVRVTCKCDKNGNTLPVTIIWEDGRRFEIERIIHVCRASDNDDFEGLRYTVLICGVQKYLYFYNNQWSVICA